MKTISFSDEEISLITYALRELANRRAEQAIEYRGDMATGAKLEAIKIRKLEGRFYETEQL